MAGIAQRPPCRHVISGLRQKNTNTENSSKGKTRCLEAASPWSQGDCQPPPPTFQSPPKRVMEPAAPMGAPGKKGGGRCPKNVSAWPGRSGSPEMISLIISVRHVFLLSRFWNVRFCQDAQARHQPAPSAGEG